MPLAMILEGPMRIVARETPRRALQPWEARVAVERAGVCGTDLAIWSGAYVVPLPLTPGHEWVGRVIEAGDPAAGREWSGRRVTAGINITCLSRGETAPCAACRRGESTHCLRREVTGIIKAGGAFQRELIVPWRNLHALPDAMSGEEGVWLEPLAAALRTFELSAAREGDFVVVLGAGRLGALIALAARALGAQTLAVTRGEERAQALRALGLEVATLPPDFRRDPTLNPLAPAPSPLLDLVLERKAGLGADLVVEATGSPDSLALALDLARPRGAIALKSTPGAPVPQFALTRAVVNEITLQGSRCGSIERAIEFQATRRLPLASLLRERYPLEELESALRAALRSSGKILVDVEP